MTKAPTPTKMSKRQMATQKRYQKVRLQSDCGPRVSFSLSKYSHPWPTGKILRIENNVIDLSA